MKKFIVFLGLALGVQFFVVSCSSFMVEVQDAVYVSPSGDDSNRGLKDSPVKSLDKALDIAKEKSVNVIYIEEGMWLYFSPTTFVIPSNLKIKGGYDSSFSKQDSFSMFSNVSFKISSVENVELDSLIVANSKIEGIRIENSKNILLQYCVLSGISNNSYSSDQNVEGVAIRILYSSDIELKKSLVTRCYGAGYRAFGAGVFVYRSSDISISEVTIFSCDIESYSGYQGGSAIAVYGSTNVVISDNIISNCSVNDSAVFFYGAYSEGIVLKNNIIGPILSLGWGIYEDIDITNHVVIGNQFFKPSYPDIVYYDKVNNRLNVDDLNSGMAGSLEAHDNIVVY